MTADDFLERFERHIAPGGPGYVRLSELSADELSTAETLGDMVAADVPECQRRAAILIQIAVALIEYAIFERPEVSS